MKCTSCGSDAVVKRGDTYFCGTCAITRDWQELIAIVQNAHTTKPSVDATGAKSA